MTSLNDKEKTRKLGHLLLKLGHLLLKNHYKSVVWHVIHQISNTS